MQFAILAQSPREMALTDRILPRYFLSRIRVSIRPRCNGLAIRRAALRIASRSQISLLAEQRVCACADLLRVRIPHIPTQEGLRHATTPASHRRVRLKIGNRTVVLLEFAVKVVITYKWSNPFSKSELRLTVANSTRLHLIDNPRGTICDVQFCCGQGTVAAAESRYPAAGCVYR